MASIPGIESALEQVRIAVQRELQAQLLRDHLTGLANDGALKEWVADAIEETSRHPWVAFVEVDFFKRINDKFGYDDADLLLQKIAGVLQFSAQNHFPGETNPYRAHGDEFFLTGHLEGSEEELKLALEHVRNGVENLHVNIKDKGRMSCTVSIGWLMMLPTTGDENITSDEGEVLDFRSIRGRLELAVAEAKARGRNRVVAYEQTMRHQGSREGRGDCPQCRSKFTITVPSSETRSSDVWCPNCGHQLSRPAGILTALERPHPGLSPGGLRARRR